MTTRQELRRFAAHLVTEMRDRAEGERHSNDSDVVFYIDRWLTADKIERAIDSYTPEIDIEGAINELGPAETVLRHGFYEVGPVAQRSIADRIAQAINYLKGEA